MGLTAARSCLSRWFGANERRTVFLKFVPFGLHYSDYPYDTSTLTQASPRQLEMLQLPEQWLNPPRDLQEERFSMGFTISYEGEPPRYRWHLGCILLKMPAMSLSTGRRLQFHSDADALRIKVLKMRLQPSTGVDPRDMVLGLVGADGSVTELADGEASIGESGVREGTELLLSVAGEARGAARL